MREIRKQDTIISYRQWRARLSNLDLPRMRTRIAILPFFGEWMNRRWDCVNYHMTQLMSSHGCFGTFLARIGKADTNVYAFCDASADSAEHILYECPRWEVDREPLY